MGKRTVSFLFCLIALAMILSLVAFNAFVQNEAFAADTHDSLPSQVATVAIHIAAADCLNRAGQPVAGQHHGKVGGRKCCGTACSVLAILTSVMAIPVGPQQSIRANSECLELVSFVCRSLHRPPIA